MNAYKMVPAILTLAGLVACGKSSSSSDPTTGATTGTTRTPKGSVEAASVDELGLTGALKLDLPPALTEGSGSLRLTAAKSMEACLMRESAKQLVTQIKMISGTLCHIEAEGKNIPWNTPVVLDIGNMPVGLALQAPPPGVEGGPSGEFPGGSDPSQTPPEGASGGPAGPGTGGGFTIPKIGIYADDTDGDNIAVYICEGETTADMKLSQAFKITGSKSITKDGKSVKVSKGTIHVSSGDDTMGTFNGAIGFDSNFTEADANGMNMEVKFGFSGFSFAQKFAISAKDSGYSKVSISESGTMNFGQGDPFSFKNAGVGAFDAVSGNVLYSYDGNGQNFSTQACVDKDSLLTDCTASKFAEGGELHLTSKDVPGILPATYAPTALSGFDCAKADWSKKVTPATDSATTAKHQACDKDLMAEASASMSGMSSCFSGEGYAQSSQPAEIDFSELNPGDFNPELPPAPPPAE